PKDPIDMKEWSQKFEGMNPFVTSGSQTLSEDKNFWSSAPIKSSPTPARRPGKARTRGMAKTNGEKAPNQTTTSGGGGSQFDTGTANIPPVFPGFKVDPPAETKEDFIFDLRATAESPRKTKSSTERTKPEGPSDDPLFKRGNSTIPPAQPPIPILNPPV